MSDIVTARGLWKTYRLGKNVSVDALRGLDVSDQEFRTSTFYCGDCPNNCEVVQVKIPEDDDKVIARWGSRCGKWDLLSD